MLCGSVSVILRGEDFGATIDIDVCNHVDPSVVPLVASACGDRALFDFAAAGAVGLFIDYEERLIPLLIPFKYLAVFYLSTLDWVVSKLASPKVDDVLNVSNVNLEMLYWMRDNFSELYGGISNDRALGDLNWLIREKGG